jgi:hypothetical protein
MNNKFDELAKGLAQSITRRGALKKFCLGLAGIALAALGLPEKASADPNPNKCLPSGFRCRNKNQCCSRLCIDSICE